MVVLDNLIGPCYGFNIRLLWCFHGGRSHMSYLPLFGRYSDCVSGRRHKQIIITKL